jgi:hypothetical protein
MKKGVILFLLVKIFIGNVMAQKKLFCVIKNGDLGFISACKNAFPSISTIANQTSFLSALGLEDSVYAWSWDTSSETWTGTYKVILSYDANNNCTSGLVRPGMESDGIILINFLIHMI